MGGLMTGDGHPLCRCHGRMAPTNVGAISALWLSAVMFSETRLNRLAIANRPKIDQDTECARGPEFPTQTWHANSAATHDYRRAFRT